MWRNAACVPVYAPRDATTGHQVLSVSTNGQDYTAFSMPIHYYNESSVFHVTPTLGSVMGGTVVTVTGPPDFIPSPEGRCRFGNTVVEATVSASTVKCRSPSITSGQTVAMAVALDGQHFVCVSSASNGMCSYFYFEQVRIMKLFPSIGATGGGLLITVTGVAFLASPTARCRFGDIWTAFDVSGSTTGSCVTPVTALPGVVPFAVTINGIDEESLSAGFQYYRIPVLAKLNPNGASLAGGATITVVGQDFQEFLDHLVLCRFRLRGQQRLGAPAYLYETNHTDTVVASGVSGGAVICSAPHVPRNASGRYDFQVSLIGTRTMRDSLVAVGEEWSSSLEFIYYHLPVMHSMRPVTGSLRGGTSLLAVLSNTVKLDTFARCVFEAQRGTSVVYTQADVVSDQTVSCTTPDFEDVQDRFPSVRIALNGQDLTNSRSHMFTYVEEAMSLALLPTMTTLLGGTVMRIAGSNFAASYWSKCVFRADNSGDVPAPATVVSSEEARCQSPRLTTPGTYQLSVSPSDTFEGTAVAVVVTKGAHVASVLPSHGLLRGATSVTVMGVNFVTHKIPICLFGLRMIEGRHVDEQHIVCKSPPSPVAALFHVSVSVSLDGGVSYFNSTKTYEYYPLLKVEDFNPQLGVDAGGTSVTIRTSGTRNVSGVTCRFGAKTVPGTIASNSASGDGVLKCISPPHAEGLVQFAVSLNGQDDEFALAKESYRFHRPLVAKAIWPTAGPIAGGTTVTLTADQGSRSVFVLGLDFVERPSLLPPDPMPTSRWVACRVGGHIISGRQFSGKVECRVPACTGLNASGMVRIVEVSTNGQEFASSPFYRFMCAEMPSVDRVLPSMGPAEVGSRVTLYGSNFTGTSRSRCAVGNLSSPALIVNSTLAYCNARPIFQRNVSRQARDLVLPPTTPPATATPAVGVMGLNWVTLAVDGQHYSNNERGNYTYYPSASVRKIDPPTATTMEGAVTVTIYGHGFLPHNDAFAQCRFGSTVVRAHVNSSELLECKAPPMGRGVAVLVELSFNHNDFEGHNSVFFLRLAPAPLVQEVIFASSLNQVEIRWFNTTDRASFRSPAGMVHCGVSSQHPCSPVYAKALLGPFDCSLVIEVSDALLGHGSSCRWRDNHTLVVSLGTNPSILPGQGLRLLPSAVMQGAQLSFYSIAPLPTIKLPGSDQFPSPVPVLSAPSVVGACEDLLLDASMSYNHGGRPLNFSWSLVSPTSCSNISDALAAYSGPEHDPTRRHCRAGVCSKVSLASGLLSPQTYTFMLTVTSWVGLKESATVTVVKTSRSEVPSVRILAPSAWQARASQRLEVVARLGAPACSATPAPDIAVKWSVKEKHASGSVGSDLLASASVLSDSPTLRLLPHTLAANKQYLIEVTASSQSSASAASTTVTVATGKVVAWINGGDRRVGHDQDVWLDASASLDPDAKPGSLLPLKFAWTCQVRGAGGFSLSPCASLVANFTFEGVNSSLARLPLASAPFSRQMCSAADSNSSFLCLVGRELLFTVRVSRADGSGSATAAVGVLVAHSNTTALVNISTAPCGTLTGRCRVNVAQPLVLHASLYSTAPALSSRAWVTNWSTVQGDVDISRGDVSLTDAASLTLVLKPHVLSAGSLYTFRLHVRRASAAQGVAGTATGAGARHETLEGGYAQVVVECNAAPSGGRFFIDRTRGEALTSNFSLAARGWSDDAADMPLKYSFAAVVGNHSSTTSNSTATVTVISSSLLPWHLVRLPLGHAPLYSLDLVLQVEDALGSVAVQRECWLESSAATAPLVPCRVAVASPAATRAGVVDLLVEFAPKLRRAAGSQQVDVVVGLVGAMLSLLDSGGGGASSRRLVQVSASLAQLRSIRDTLVDTLAGLVHSWQHASLLGLLQLETIAGQLKGVAQEPAQLSPASQVKMLTAADAILRGLGDGVASSSPEDIAVMISSLRNALVHSSLEMKEMNGDAAVQQQNALEACIDLLTRKALAGHTPGQVPVLFPSFATPQSEFETYGRVYRVERGASMAALKTESIIAVGGQRGWGLSAVIINMPEVALADSEVRAPPSQSKALPAAAAAVEMVVTVWRANASMIKDVVGTGGLAAAAGPLLGQYVSVALYWHGIADPESKLRVTGLATPLRLGMTASVPNSTLDSTTGRTSNVAVCAYLEDSGRSWGVRGMSFAMNSSSLSPYSVKSSAASAGSAGLAVCEASHLTSFSVRAEATGCDDVPRSPIVLDRCRVCGGNNSCVDCADTPFGGKKIDACGICGGNNSLTSCLGCDGVIYPPGAARVFDACQVLLAHAI